LRGALVTQSVGVVAGYQPTQLAEALEKFVSDIGIARHQA
jgi:hypothetical protein